MIGIESVSREEHRMQQTLDDLDMGEMHMQVIIGRLVVQIRANGARLDAVLFAQNL